MSGWLLAQGDARRLALPDRSVDLVFGSPPYVDARLYLEDGRDLGISRDCVSWVEWMLGVTAECLRVSRGAVVWIAAGVTRDRNYQPACEGLMWEWYRRGLGHAYRPCYWHRYGIPGSGSGDWFRADVEYVMCFKRSGVLPGSDPLRVGHQPKFKAGGAFSHRQADGTQVGRGRSWGLTVTRRLPSGQRTDGKSPCHERYATEGLPVANPGNVFSTGASGHLGSRHAHDNEAPFPEALAEHFVRSLCPPGGTVLDPFSGSATTAAVAAKHDRRGIGFDLRRSQCELGRRRIPDTLAPRSRLDATSSVTPSPGQLPLFAETDAS